MNAWKWMLAIICFNIGIVIMGTISYYSGGDYYHAIGHNWNIANLTILPLIGSFSLAITVSAAGTLVLNYDPIKLAGIGGFVGLMMTQLWNSFNILTQLAGNNPMLSLMISIFTAIMAILTLVFVYQLATQGFKSME